MLDAIDDVFGPSGYQGLAKLLTRLEKHCRHNKYANKGLSISIDRDVAS